MIALTKKIAKYSDVKRQTDHGQTELSNMLEECIKWNKKRRNIHLRFQGLQENEKESISKFRRASKLADHLKRNFIYFNISKIHQNPFWGKKVMKLFVDPTV